MKQKRIALVLALALLFCSGCGSPTAGTVETNAATAATAATAQAAPAAETESDDGTLRITALSPLGEVDVVNEKIRGFIDLAHERYRSGDTSFSVKTDDTIVTLSSVTRFQWEIKNGNDVKSVAVQYGTDPEFAEYSEAQNKRTNVSSLVVTDLRTVETYYWRLALTLKSGETVFSDVYSFETMPGPDILKIGGVKNARDAGKWPTEDGKVVPGGRVFRSANLDHPDDDGKRMLLEELGIKTELDLRSTAKDTMAPVLTDSLNYINISGSGYTNFFPDPANNAKVMRVFTKPENYPILFHCAGGADRTGTLAFMLNALCGVGETDLVCDYELTEGRFRNGVKTDEHTYNFPAFLKEFWKRPGETTQEKARSFYLDECGLSEMEIANIYNLRMNGSGVYADPPQKAIEARGGKISAKILLRSAGAVAGVTGEDGAALPFTFENGVLTVTVSGSGSATVTFDDGGTLPILWNA